MSETITADHLNATHLGKRITINGKHGTVMSGKLKKIRADYAIKPSFTTYSFREEDIPKPLGYRKDVHIIMHLSNQVNDDSDILPRLMRGGGFLLKNPNGFSIDRLSPHALWFARCFTSRAARRFFWLRPGCSGRRSRPGRA